MRKIYLALALMTVFTVGGFTQSKLIISTGEFVIPALEDENLSQYLISDWPKFNGNSYGIVGLDKFPSRVEQSTLAENGIEFISYLPSAYYLISISGNAQLENLALFQVKSAAPYLNEFRSAVDFNSAPSRAVVDQDYVLVNAHPFSNITLFSVRADLPQGIEVMDIRETYHHITLKVNVDQLESIKSHSALQYIDWAYDYGEPENYTGRTAHRGNVISSENSNGLNFDGNGIAVMLQDDGAIGPHIDHEGRIAAQFWAGNLGDHGDHVGGTIAGAGNIDPNNAGQAKAADLYVYKAAPEYQGYDSIANHYNTFGVVISSTSYSNGCNAGYTSLARTMDQQVFSLPSLMHVFSAGNSGTSNCGYGAGNVWGNITGGHKVGKNVIAVANLTSYDVVATSSSRGPAHDGRIKPDVSAKGTNVMSTLEDNEYGSKTGTSMSCPGVSGTLAQLYDAYESLNGSLPDGGLMKAIVLNTADDLGNVGPDFIHGWGRINARKAYELMAANNIVNGSASQGGQNTHTVSVPSGVSKARFMVYWTDPEASINAATALINDIDVVVVTPSGDTIMPWVLDPTPNPATLGNPAIHGEDHLNNVEQVEMNSVGAGSYTVVVNGESIPMGPQGYYLVYWFETDEMTLTYPIGGESFEPLTTEVIRWDANNDSTNFALEYSTDGGSTWTLINASINPSTGYYLWTVPNAASGKCKVKITQGSSIIESAAFSIVPTTENLIVDWACPDSIGLSWTASASATSFDVYSLGEKYMDSIGTSATTNFVDYGSNPMSNNLWYSASANGPDDAKSKRQIAIQKAPGVFNCLLPLDLGLEQLFPLSSSIYPCFGEQNAGFIVKNYGDSPALLFDASYSLNGVQQASQSFSVNIAPNSMDTLYFTSTVAFQSGLNEMKVFLDFTGDLNLFNDTLGSFYLKVDEVSQEPIWAEDFDSYSTCSDDPDCGGTTCLLTNGWTNESNGIIDDVDWRVFSGATFSSGTGPSGDNTSGSGNYIYIESSGDCSFNQANLISPCFDLSLSSAARLTFYYHMFGLDMGELHVDVYDGSIWHLDVTPALIGNQGGVWRYVEADLSAFSGMNVNVRFRGITGTSFRSDIAIDDISIIHLPVANFDYITQTNGQTILFSDMSQYANTMTFDLGDGSMVQDSVPELHNYNQQINYSVTQIVYNEFGSDTMTKEIMNLGLDADPSLEFSIYPNPAQDQINIVLKNSYDGFEIRSADGRLVMSVNTKGLESTSIDLSNMSNGVYFISAMGDQTIQAPLIIAR